MTFRPELKIIFLSFAAGLFVTPQYVSAVPSPSCSGLFYDTEYRRPLMALVNKVVSFGITFEVLPVERYKGEAKLPSSFEILALKEKDEIGHIFVEQLAKEFTLERGTKVFRSSIISVDARFTGKGIGALLYALAAEKAFLEQGVLYSSGHRSLSATNTWLHLFEAGWVREVGSPYNFKDEHQTDAVFTFKQELLKEEFFAPLGALMKHSP